MLTSLSRFIEHKWIPYLAGLLILVILFFEAQTKGDFTIFYSAASDLLHEKNIYKELYNEWYHYYYSVLFAVFLSPFTLLPVYPVTLLWLILNIVFLYRIWKILGFYLSINDLRKEVRIYLALFVFIFMARFIRDNIHLAQMTICMLYLSLEGLLAMHKKKYGLAGFLIALGINIKLMPIFLIPYLIYRAEWKTFIFTIIYLVFLTFLPAIFIGWEYHSFLLNERWKLINPMNSEHILDVSERSFHSITTLLSTLLIENAGNSFTLSLKRNIMDIGQSNLRIVINVVRLLFIFLTLYFLKGLPFKKMRNRLQILYETSYIFIMIPLLFPHQQHYAFLFVFPAISYLMYYMIAVFYEPGKQLNSKNISRRNWMIAFMIVIYLLTNANLILGHFHNYYDHYKILTYGIFLLIALLASCKPKKIALNR